VDNTNDLNEAVGKALADSSYYLIGYRPSASTFDASHALKFHRLDVRIKRPGLHVREQQLPSTWSKREYVAAPFQPANRFVSLAPSYKTQIHASGNDATI
jgi:hypothetical protein